MKQLISGLSIFTLSILLSACGESSLSADIETEDMEAQITVRYSESEDETASRAWVSASLEIPVETNEQYAVDTSGLELSGGDQFIVENLSKPEAGQEVLEFAHRVIYLIGYSTKDGLIAEPGDTIQITFDRGDEAKTDVVKTIIIPEPPILNPDNLTGSVFANDASIILNWDVINGTGSDVRASFYCMELGKTKELYDTYYVEIQEEDLGTATIEMTEVTPSGSLFVSSSAEPKAACTEQLKGKVSVERITWGEPATVFSTLELEAKSKSQDYVFLTDIPPPLVDVEP